MAMFRCGGSGGGKPINLGKFTYIHNPTNRQGLYGSSGKSTTYLPCGSYKKLSFSGTTLSNITHNGTVYGYMYLTITGYDESGTATVLYPQTKVTSNIGAKSFDVSGYEKIEIYTQTGTSFTEFVNNVIATINDVTLT